MRLKVLVASAITSIFFAPLSFADADNVMLADNNATTNVGAADNDASSVGTDANTTNDPNVNVGSTDKSSDPDSTDGNTKDDTATMDDTDY